MKEFMMLFHSEPNPDFNPTPEEIQAEVKQWQDWIGGIAAQAKFVDSRALGFEGKTVSKGGLVTDGPYVAAKEIVGGYLLVNAENLEEAVRLAEGCPVLAVGGKVEIRDIMIIENA